jgi:hypothetical protein
MAEGTLTILDHVRPRVIEFNGVPEEREAVEQEFKNLMRSGNYLAFKVEEKTGKKVQIRENEFPSAEENPKVVLTPHLVGG